MINIEVDRAPRFVAWAYGYCLQAAHGRTGVSASAWEVRPSGSDQMLVHKALASRGANHWVWEAAIMAVVGVLEAVPPQAIVTIYVKDEELASAIPSRFRNSSRKPMAGQEYWSKLLQLWDAKNISLIVKRADSTDQVMFTVVLSAKHAAHVRLNEIGEDRAAACSDGPKRRSGPSFPVIEGYEEKPVPIRRKKGRRGEG